MIVDFSDVVLVTQSNPMGPVVKEEGGLRKGEGIKVAFSGEGVEKE